MKYETSAHNLAVTAMNILDGMNHQQHYEMLQPVWEAYGYGFDGFCGWIAEIAQASEDLLVKRNPQDFPGVYDYEVSCELGDQLVTFINGTRRLPTKEEWMPMLTSLADAFFAQGDGK